MKTPPWLEWMKKPSFYPHDAAAVTCIQTHISWVFIAGDFVYKVKKPVDFGFLDFTTLEKRRHFCKEEVRLNRRLCPEIYLTVIPITEEAGMYRLNGTGTPVEWVVRMKRMPEDGMMGRMIVEDRLDEKDLTLVISRLVPFYEKEAATGEKIAEFGKLDVISHNTEENFDQTESFIDTAISRPTFDAIRSYTRGFIRDKEALFHARIQGGWIKEGHGDLYSANICFDRPRETVYIFDCIEFNERFRCGDVAADVAFLAMDLDFHGLPILSKRFIDEFARRTNDDRLLELIPFYKCYRAYVRGKINCFTSMADGLDPRERDLFKQTAREYFALAHRYTGATQDRPELYVFYGLPGTGKSTVSSAWAERKGLVYYNSDRVRKEIVAGIPALERRHEAFEAGIYSGEMSRRTYAALARFAGRHLMRGESVVLDATYRDGRERAALLELAACSEARIRFILCECPEDVVRQRLKRRAADRTSVSDGRWEIYQVQKKTFDPHEALPSDQPLIMDTSRPLEDILGLIPSSQP